MLEEERDDGQGRIRRNRPGVTVVLFALGWLFTTFVGISFIRYRSDSLGAFAIGASLAMIIGILMFSLRPDRSRVWSFFLIATSVVYWAGLFSVFGDQGLVWGLAGPFYVLVGGALGLISNPGSKTKAS